MLPTLYFLTVRKCPYDGDLEWAVFERHMCQEKGCIKTDEELVGWFETKEEAITCAENYQDKLIEGIVDSIEVE